MIFKSLFIFRGAEVYIVCRNPVAGEEARKEIKTISSNLNIYLEIADISSPKSIKELVKRIEKKPLDILVI